jgi:two-component system phosphate regulon sensor histidine kinase PhoR
MSWPRRFAFAVGGTALVAALLTLLLVEWRGQVVRQRFESGRLGMVAKALSVGATGLLGATPADAYAAASRWSAASGFRVTLIAGDGTVRADSVTEPELITQMENHGRRPEVLQARQAGTGLVTRRSATTNRLTTYLAERLGPADHPVGYLRVAWEEPKPPFPWMGVLAALATAAVAGLAAGGLTRRWQLAVGRHLSPWCDLPADEDLDALAEEADRSFRAVRDSLEQELAVTRSALAEVSQGVILLDHAERVRYANPAAVEYLGEQLTVGRLLVEAVRTPELIAAVRDALTRNETAHTAVQLISGAELAVRVCPLPHPVLAAAVVLRDLSGQRQLERARRALVADLAHELRTPITVLGALAEELREEGANLELVPSLERQVRRLRAFAEELEELTSIESGQLKLQAESVDVLNAARAAVADLEALAAQLRVTIRLDGEDTPIVTDPVRLAQVLTNLIDNAVRYNRPDGSVTVTVRRDGEQATIRVEDTGIGIPEADQPLVFQRFYRVRRGGGPEGGSGLGLAIVKHLVRALGGGIQLTSREGEGTQVTIELPGTPPGRP